MPKRIIKKESVTNEEKLRDLLAYTTPNGECMIWKGAVNTDGYAHMLGNVKVHRLVYQLKHNEDITGLVVRHSCDTPLCLNPEHLSSGTPLDNIDDMYLRERRHSTLTHKEVHAIRDLLGTGNHMNKDIAAMFGVDPRTISSIKHGKHWKRI